MLFPIGSRVVSQMRDRKFYQFPKSAKSEEKTLFERTFSMSMWDYLRGNAAQRKVFDLYMGARRDGARPQWFEIYPAGKELSSISGNDGQEAVLLVDVGGGHGHETVKFQEQYPHLKGRFILQDLLETLAGIDTPLEAVEIMPYDFFTPQPVKGMSYFIYKGCMK